MPEKEKRKRQEAWQSLVSDLTGILAVGLKLAKHGPHTRWEGVRAVEVLIGWTVYTWWTVDVKDNFIDVIIDWIWIIVLRFVFFI